MKKLLPYLVLTVVAAYFLAVSCTSYGSKIDYLNGQLAALREECRTMNDNAEGITKIIEALQQNDEMVSFSPIAKGGEVTGFKVTFKDAGEITIYNQTTAVSVGEEDGKYYWMDSGEWMHDASGNRIEISSRTPLPQFAAEEGILKVSVDGGHIWRILGDVDKALITSVTEDAARVVFTLSGGAVIVVPKPRALSVMLEGDDARIAAGESVEITYTINGAEDAEITVSVMCGDGWKVQVSPQNATGGTIIVTAPNPITAEKVVLLAGDGKGRLVAVKLRLDIDTSGGDEPPTPPDPPAPEPILMPVQTAYSVEKEGGEVVAGLITNVNYTVVTDGSWLQYVGTKAVRTDNMVFNVEPNEGSPRVAAATIFSGNYSTAITFRQKGINRYIVISNDRLEFDFEQESKSFTISTNVDYSCEVSDEWVTLSQMASSGSDRYLVSVADNPLFEARSATITVSPEGLEPKVVTIHQAAKSYYLSVSKEIMSFQGSSGADYLRVKSNADYSVEPSAGWISVSGTPGQGQSDFTVSVSENDSYDERSGTVTFFSAQAGNKVVMVVQQGKPFPLPRTEGGANLYSAPTGAHYRYGPSIILNEDRSIDVWTSKEGGRYLNCTADYTCQETGARSKVNAYGHTIAQYFNVQHRFMRVMVNFYGTGTTDDSVNLKLYKWAGSYEATLATNPLSTFAINNTTLLYTSGNFYSIYKDEGHSWMGPGEYMWTVTDATEGVGVFEYPGAGTIYLTDSKSYVDGVPASDYNFQARLRGSAYNSSRYADSFAYWHSADGGVTWSTERDVFFGTEGSEDSWSVCDPGSAHFGGWYYLGYTSAKGEPGVFNHCYLARSRSPQGPWYKWNGSGWGGEPAKVVTFNGDAREWGAGEPSIVVKDNTVYFYHSWVEGYSETQGGTEVVVKPSTRKTYVWTAPLADDWPAHLTFRGVAMDQTQLSSSDSADVKYVEDHDLFYAFHTYYRMTSLSKIAVWTSADGINFTFRGNLGGTLQPGAHNMGVSGDGEGHIRLAEPQYVSYAYGGSGWGNWNTWFAPLYFEEL